MQVGDAAGEAKAILLPRRPWHQQGPTGGRGAGDADGEAQLRSGDSGVEEEDAALANEGGQQRRSLVQRPTLDRELLSRSGVRGGEGLGRRRGLGAAPTRGLRPRGRMARGPSAGLLDGGGSPGVEVEARGGELGRGSRRRPRPAEVQASRQGDGRATGVGRQGGCAGSGGTGQGGSRRRRRTKGSGRSSRRERWRRCEEEEGTGRGRGWG